MNRHVKLAILVAPFLALGGYIAAGYFTSSKQTADIPALPLSVEGPCLPYGSGCMLKGIKLVLKLRITSAGGEKLSISASRPLEGITLQIVDSEQQPPQQLQQEDALHWRLTPDNPLPSSARIRLAAASSNALYFGEITLGNPQ